MVKHLHFNPSNFNQLILSGLLIEMYKDDIQCHPTQQTDELKFVQGPNIVENTIEGILKFANADCHKKYFGLNAQQEAVINMLNGVCKDVDTKLASTKSDEELAQKVGYLNEFWANPSYEWFKKNFYYCHMKILTLSFRVQDKFPDMLLKYSVFVQLRRLFISDKWLSKRALVSMFANPYNVYQEFDLFPETEGECSLKSSFGVPAEGTDEDYSLNQLEENFVEIQAVEIPDGSEKDGRMSYHQKQKLDQRFTESEIEHPHYHNQVESHITENEFRNIDSDISKLNSENTTGFQVLQEKDRLQKLDDESKIEVVESIVPEELSVIANKLAPEITSDQVNLKVHEETKDQERLRVDKNMHDSSEFNQKNINSSENDGLNETKKSFKQSFSQNVAKPLEYQTKSFTDYDEKITKIKQSTQRPQQTSLQNQKKNHQDHHEDHFKKFNKTHGQQKRQEKVSVSHEQKQNKAQKSAPVQLKKQLVIDEAQSEKYVSQQQQEIHTDTRKVQGSQKPQGQLSPQTTKQPTESQRQVNPQQTIPSAKAAQSESLASKNGPKTHMKQEIKPREQPVQASKESCKCEIY